MTSSIDEGSSLVSSINDLITIDPNLCAGKLEKAPWKLPIGVRLAETITTFLCGSFN